MQLLSGEKYVNAGMQNSVKLRHYIKSALVVSTAENLLTITLFIIGR